MSTNASLGESIVVTGIGVISPIGVDLEQFYRNLHSTDPIEHDGTARFSGHIDDFGPLAKDTKRLIRKSIKLMNRETQLGVAAAQHAITDSGLLSANYQSDRVGVTFGAGNVEIRRSDFRTGIEACEDLMKQFDPALWGRLGVPHVDPLWILRVLPNMPACHAAIANDLRGPNNTITQATVATNMAFAEARNVILDGDADAMVVGGTGTHLLETLPTETELSAPPAEAAAAFVIERMQRAVERGATIYGEILGAGAATAIDFDHRSRPDEAITGAIQNACHQSRFDSKRITSIRSNRNADDFRDIVDQLSKPTFESIVQRTGDAAAGSSALSIAASLLELYHNQSGLQREHAATINIDAMDNGLASCVIFASANAPIQARDVA